MASLTPRTVALPEGEGASGGPVYGGAVGWTGVVWRGCQEGEGAEREQSKAWHESGQGQGEGGEAGGQRRRAGQGGEQGQGGPDQAQEAFERQQQRGDGHLGIGLQGLPGQCTLSVDRWEVWTGWSGGVRAPASLGGQTGLGTSDGA